MIEGLITLGLALLGYAWRLERRLTRIETLLRLRSDTTNFFKK